MAETLPISRPFNLEYGKEVVAILYTQLIPEEKEIFKVYGFLVDFVVIDLNIANSGPRHCFVTIYKWKAQETIEWWSVKRLHSDGLAKKSGDLWSFGAALPVLFKGEAALRDLILSRWNSLDEITQLPNLAPVWPSEATSFSSIPIELYYRFIEQFEGKTACQYVASSAALVSEPSGASMSEPSHPITDVTRPDILSTEETSLYSLDTGWKMLPEVTWDAHTGNTA
jgi:hypothetical protein